MINPRVESVLVLDNFQLSIKFTNNEQKLFDMKPYLDQGVFKVLKDETLFKKVFMQWGTVAWSDDLDMSSDTLYIEGE